MLFAACSKGDDENNNSGNDDSSDSAADFEPGAEDQEGLGIGDTGTFDTTLGSYEITLDAAKLVGPELDGEASQFDDLIVLDITDDKETSGSFDSAKFFDSIDMLSGELNPDEERSGHLGIIRSFSRYFYTPLKIHKACL